MAKHIHPWNVARSSTADVTRTVGHLLATGRGELSATTRAQVQDVQESLREARTEVARWKAKSDYWQGVAQSAGSSINAERIADEIMLRIERDGAIHRDALIEVARLYAKA